MKRSWRMRTVIDNAGKEVRFQIRRLHCIKCNRIHHELPNCVVPYKRHCAETIENIIKGDSQVPCEIKTISRILAWWAALEEYFMSILKSLAQKYKVFYKDPPTFKEIMRAVTNSSNWTFAHLICTRSVSLAG